MQVGARLGLYETLAPLGAGGMGEVAPLIGVTRRLTIGFAQRDPLLELLGGDSRRLALLPFLWRGDFLRLADDDESRESFRGGSSATAQPVALARWPARLLGLDG